MPVIKFPDIGKEYAFDYKMTRDFTYQLPQGSQYTALACALLELDIPSITEAIIQKASLPTAILDEIWEKNEFGMRIVLAATDKFIVHLSNKQAEDILQSDHVMLPPAISFCRNLIMVSELPVSRRLSVKLAKRLLEKIQETPKPVMYASMLGDKRGGGGHVPRVREQLQANIIPESINFSNMDEEDEAILATVPICIVEWAASQLETIKNDAIRGRLFRRFTKHKDPGVRICLAANPATPEWILKILSKDKEPDVRDEVWSNPAYEIPAYIKG